ncbi:hypothetical protein [Variovorax sp. UC74_104]|uniref:hypothetical protein n=1 Tax=Variovorax sp. UC74_104 TaxID=3374555 RepID=UPI003757F2EE
MPPMTTTLPPDFLATLRQPVLREADLETKSSFFSRKEVMDFYVSVMKSPEKNDVLQLAAAELPVLHPHRAALLALFCGALVEEGADPHLLFGAALEIMSGLLVSLSPSARRSRRRTTMTRIPTISPNGRRPMPRSVRCRRRNVSRSRHGRPQPACWCFR